MNRRAIVAGSFAAGLLLALAATGRTRGAVLAQGAGPARHGFPRPAEATATPGFPIAPSHEASLGSAATSTPPAVKGSPTDVILPNPVAYSTVSERVGTHQLQAADPEDRLIASGDANQEWPDTAYDPTNGQYLVVWTDDNGGGSVRGRFMSRLGTMGGQEFTIVSSLIGQPYRPSIAANPTDGSFLILWSELNGGVFEDGVFNLSTYNLYALAVNSAGAPLEGSPTIVTTALTFYYVPFAGYDVAYNSVANEYFVVWQQPPGIVVGDTIHPHHVMGRKLTSTGLASGAQVSLVNGSVGSIALAYSSQSNEYLYTFDRFSRLWVYDLYGQRLHADTLAPAGPIFNTQGMLALRDQYDANIAYSAASNLYLITYGDVPLVSEPNGPHVRGRFLEAGTGTLAPYTFSILPPVWDTSVVWNGGVAYCPVDQRFLATGWTPSGQLMARLIADGGNPVGDPFQVTELPAAYGPHIVARLDGLETSKQWLVTWNTPSDVYARFASSQPVVYPYTTIFEGPGFDRCDTPSVEDLQVWWDLSPYRFVGIYYGGNNRICDDQLQLSPAESQGREWVRQVTAMGWKILPIWAGPSPGCRSTTGVVMNSDPVVARQEGADEASAAVDAAYALGLVGEDRGGTVIYYDMEAFDATLHAWCAPAASAFVEGWSSMMRSLGNLPGVYGTVANATPWFGLAERPDVIWLARWHYQRFEYNEKDGKEHGVYEYDPLETVWGIEGIPDSYWGAGQRVYQYTDTHTESYGGIAWSICSSVADGTLAIGADTAMLHPAPAPSAFPAAAAPAGPGSMVIDAIELLSPSEGWVLAGGDLLWSHDGGETWVDITPPEADDEVVLAVKFPDPLHGWVMSALPSPSYSTVELSLSRTSDGGQTWETSPFRTFDEFAFPQSADLEFIDPDTGWAVVRLGSSSNSSDGLLFRTTDGGENWSEASAPSGNPVRFLTPNHGWALSGPGRHELLETTDGGSSWTPVSLVLPPETEPRNLVYGLPVFENESLGLLPVILSDSTGTQIWFHITDDGGTSWFVDQGVEIDEQVGPSSVFPVEIIDTEHWVLPTTGGLSGLAGPVLDLAFASPEVGWATIGGGECTEDSGGVTCTLLSGLYGTTDGGDSWEPILIPAYVLHLPVVFR